MNALANSQAEEIGKFMQNVGPDGSGLTIARYTGQESNLLCIGTSATMSSTGTAEDQKRTVSTVASKLFGTNIEETDIIDETLERATEPSMGLETVKPLLAERLAVKTESWADLPSFRRDPLVIASRTLACCPGCLPVL